MVVEHIVRTLQNGMMTLSTSSITYNNFALGFPKTIISIMYFFYLYIHDHSLN